MGMIFLVVNGVLYETLLNKAQPLLDSGAIFTTRDGNYALSDAHAFTAGEVAQILEMGEVL